MPNNEGLPTLEEGKASSVHLRGELSKPPSRALWLLKWLLAIPHVIVLAFLLVAMSFVTIIAFFAILFTGKYPRKLFDFVVGVLRWGWRVGFYAFSALGTDKYPPFSLKPREDYPADFHIDYSERLNHWLPLVKWFLAIPHYFVLIAFLGSGGDDINESDQTSSQNSSSSIEVLVDDSDVYDALAEPSRDFSLFFKGRTGRFDMDAWDSWRPSFPGFWLFPGGRNFERPGFPGLRLILIIIALIALLFTGRYHKDIFRLVMGINRWVYRTTAYIFLLTDEYPHFRLMD